MRGCVSVGSSRRIAYYPIHCVVGRGRWVGGKGVRGGQNSCNITWGYVASGQGQGRGGGFHLVGWGGGVATAPKILS